MGKFFSTDRRLRGLLAEKVRRREVDVFRIDMPNFLVFKERFESMPRKYAKGGGSGA